MYIAIILLQFLMNSYVCEYVLEVQYFYGEADDDLSTITIFIAIIKL